MQETSIQWCDLVWNCVRGCSMVSSGCTRCYAMNIAARFSGSDQPFAGYAEFRIIGDKREAHWTGKVNLVEEKLLEPLSRRKWASKFAEKHGRKPRCFVNSMSDLFHEKLPDESIDRVFAVMAICQEIDFLVLTKRAARMEKWFWAHSLPGWSKEWPLANVWLGVSVEDQKRANERIPHLLRTPVAVRFISAEPLLGSVNLASIIVKHEDYRWKDCCRNVLTGEFYNCPFDTNDGLQRGMMTVTTEPKLDWVIVGGESGPGARPFDIAWARSIRDQCKAAGVACYVNQLGSNPQEIAYPQFVTDHEAENWMAADWTRIWENSANHWRRYIRLKDNKGGDVAEWPEDLRIREVPR